MLKLRILLVGVVAVVASGIAAAQIGSIQGTVSDQTGAVVQGAEVTAKNLATGIVRTAVTGSTGVYSMQNLAVGHYDFTVKKVGFKIYRLDNVELTVAQALGVDAQLEPGTVTEEVLVRASELPPVDLETSQVSNLVDARQILDLPLITRDPYSLVLLSPGASQTNTGLGGFTVNGSRERNNNFLLDGVDNNDTSVPGIPGGVLSANPDSTEEFRVITNNFNAEFGRNTGAIVDVVTKSGTNSFHGGVYEFGRWNAFGGARDWFNPPETGKLNPYVRNQFGYSLGGPIVRNKTFFFFNEEFQRFRTTLTNVSTVPTAAFKTGKFTYNGAALDITQNGANNATPTILQQFNKNLPTIPAAPGDAVMAKVFALYPNPTIDNGDGYTGTLLFPSSSQQNSYQAVAKIDHHFTDQESLSARYGYNHFFDPNPFHNDILPGNVGGVDEKSINQGLAANLTSTLRNNLINSLSFGWNRIYSNFGCTGTKTLDSVVPQVDQFGNGWDFSMDPFTSFGCLALVSDGQWRKTGTTSYTDGLSWVHHGHTFKFGGDFRDIGEQGPNGFFSRRQVGLATAVNFGLQLVQGAPGPFSFALNDAAAAYYGLVWNDFGAEFFNKAAARQATDNKHFRQHEYDWYGQDSWKVRSNITLTLGLRYQLDGVPYEEGANFSNLLTDPTTFPVVMSTVGPGTGKSIYQSDYSDIEPRVGFSWDPWKDGKTAIRGAFGIFHDRVFGNLFGNARGNPPFEQDYQAFPLDTTSGFYGGNINGPFVLPAIPPTTPSASIPLFNPNTGVGGLAPIIFDTHFKNSASNNWNFGIQREIPGNMTIDLSYVASKGTHIYREMDGNPPDPTLVAQLVAFCSDPTNAFGCTPSTVTKTNLYDGAEFGRLPFDAVKYNALIQPFYIRSVGNSNYHSMQLKVTHRLSHGLQVQGSYTWAHALDDSGDPLVPAAGNRGFPRNSRNLAEEYGNSDNDLRHILVIDYIWEAPIGRGKAYLNHGVFGKIFEGIQFSGITSVQTGHPFDVYSTTDSERTGLSNRGSLVGDPFAPGTTNVVPGIKTFFTNYDPNNYPGFGAFAEPAYGGPGNIERNHFHGPGYVNFDTVFTKRIKFTERVDMQLRIEGYNIFNHPHFNNPGFSTSGGSVLGGTNFGQITSTVGRSDATTSARQMQAALKLEF